MSQTPRERRHERTKESILTAALQIIADKGPDKLSMRAIARQIDYSPAGLYEYFDNKEAIVEAVCFRSEEILLGLMLDVPQELPIKEYMVKLGEAYLQFAIEYTEYFLLQFNFFANVDAEESDAVPERFTVDDMNRDGSLGVLITAIQRAVNEGIISVKDDHHLFEIVYGMWSLVHGMAVLEISNLKNMDYDFDSAHRRIIATYIDGLTS